MPVGFLLRQKLMAAFGAEMWNVDNCGGIIGNNA